MKNPSEKGWKRWADDHIRRLKAGETVEITAHGNSMWPVLLPGAIFTLEPTNIFKSHHTNWQYPLAGRCVLVQCANVYLHRVADVVDNGSEVWYLIANCGGTNSVKTNGWVTEDAIYGVVIDYKPPDVKPSRSATHTNKFDRTT